MFDLSFGVGINLDFNWVIDYWLSFYNQFSIILYYYLFFLFNFTFLALMLFIESIKINGLYISNMERGHFEKILYDRSTNSAAFCVLQWLYSKLPFPSMQLKWLTLFLIQSILPIIKKGSNFSQSWNLYSSYCFFSVESLFHDILINI